MNDEELSFAAVVERLFTDDVISIPLVFRLSDIYGEDLALVIERWPSLSDARRAELARHMADISEANFQVDFSAVMAQLLQDRAAEVRLAALDGLWDSSNLSLVGPILEMVATDADETVQAAAAATLGHYVLMSEWGQLPGKISVRIARLLLEAWDKPDTSAATRRAIIESLGAASHPRVPEIIDSAYAGGDETSRLSAVFAMGRSADRRWRGRVDDEMASDDPAMRIEAARAAGAIGGTDFVPSLADLIADEDLEVRLAAINALGEIGGDLALEILSRLEADAAMDEADAATDAEVEAIEEALASATLLEADIDLSLMDLDNDQLLSA